MAARSVLSSLPRSASQTISVLSCPPLASRRPSAENRTVRTAAACPANSRNESGGLGSAEKTFSKSNGGTSSGIPDQHQLVVAAAGDRAAVRRKAGRVHGSRMPRERRPGGSLAGSHAPDDDLAVLTGRDDAVFVGARMRPTKPTRCAHETICTCRPLPTSQSHAPSCRRRSSAATCRRAKTPPTMTESAWPTNVCVSARRSRPSKS